MRKLVFLGIILMIIGLITVGCGGDEKPEPASTGEPSESDIAKITVHSFQESMGDEYERPKEGYVFLVIDLEVENTSGEIFTTKGSPVMDMKSMWFELKDAEGYEYSESFYIVSPNFPRGPLDPGEKARGLKPFDVKEGWNDLILKAKIGEVGQPEETVAEINISRWL